MAEFVPLMDDWRIMADFDIRSRQESRIGFGFALKKGPFSIFEVLERHGGAQKI